MSTREENKSAKVVTTTVTTVERKQDLALCELWSSLVLGVLLVIGSLSTFNWPMIAVGLISAVGSGILIFVQENKQVRVVGFWILFSALIIEAVAFLALVTVGVILMFNQDFLGLGVFFGIILLITSVPVLVMVIIDLQTVIKVRPQIFEEGKVVITETVSSMEDGSGKKGGDVPKDASDDAETVEGPDAEEEISASRRQKLPLLAIRK